MLLSKEQLSSVMAKHSERENGLHDLMEIMLESMMLAERREFLDQSKGNKAAKIAFRLSKRMFNFGK
jgi:hypothetical protein